MTVATQALLALWNDVDPAREDEYNDWHAFEHVPERLTMPGFVWARRWRADGGDGPGPRYLTLYGLAGLEALQSAAYQRLLACPTPWSQRMRPCLRHLSRWACTVESGGDSATGAHMQVASLPSPPAPAVPASPAGALLARRRQDAAPLPWLAGSQALDIPGDWLVCADALPPLPGAVYRRDFLRLPAGRDGSAGSSRWPVPTAG